MPMIPLGDENEPGAGLAIANLSLITLNIAVFIYQLAHPQFTYGYSTIPQEIVTGHDITQPVTIQVDHQYVTIPQAPGPHPIYLTLLTSMFMHAGFLHIAGNMLFLYIFGDNIERAFGSVRYVLFYLVCGLAAAFAQIAVNPNSVVPSLGASGAISGVLAAYLLLFPRNPVRVLVFAFYFARVAVLPAVVIIGIWIALQLVSGVGAISYSQQTTGVAYWAHIGGFGAGLVLAFVMRATVRRPQAYVD